MFAKYEIFPDFTKIRPNSSLKLFTNYSESMKPELEKSKKLLFDQIFYADTISKKLIEKTDFIILFKSLDILPEFEGKKSVYGYNWFVGHYDWKGIIDKFIDYQKSHTDSKCCMYVIPVMGQSVQGSERFELTYNIFFGYVDSPPFENLIQMAPRPEEEQPKDEELYILPDYADIVKIEDLGLCWKEDFTFDKSVFPDLGDVCIPVHFLNTKDGFRKKLNAMNEKDFSVWFEAVMCNFKPFIPPSIENDKITKIPTYLIEPLECTLPIWIELQDAIEKINSIHKGEQRCVQNTYKYWQLSSSDVEPILLNYINNNNQLLVNADFKEIFFQLFANAKFFIIEEVLAHTLKIKREENDEENLMFKDAPIEISIELIIYDDIVQEKYGKFPELSKALLDLKPLIEKFFDAEYQKHIKGLFDEWKGLMEEKIKKKSNDPRLLAFIKNTKEESDKKNRKEWISEFYDNKVLTTLWPTCYTFTGSLTPNSDNDKNLELIDEEIKSGAHIPVPGIQTGTTLPEKVKKI